MRQNYTWLHVILLLLVLGFSSCIKDEEPNKECDILSAWVEGDEYASNFYNVEEMRINSIISTDNQVTFTVRSLISLPTALPVFFNITPGATIEPASGSIQDFTKGPVTYTVTSEDKQWSRKYTVQFKEAMLPFNELNFEHYDSVRYSFSNMHYHKFYEVDPQSQAKMEDLWDSGNLGFCMSMLMKVMAGVPVYTTDFPTQADPNGYKGSCVKLVTMSTGDLGKAYKKPIAAGNLFFGKFITDYAATDALKATSMGVPFTDEPIRVVGYYKYKRGAEFTGADGNVIPGREDEADIYSVLYRNKDENGNAVQLDGGNVLTSPYIVRKARVASLPPTDEWKPFEMFFEGDAEIDRELLANKGYNLALVFSSSKDGALFQGAVGSTLWVDEIDFSVAKKVEDK